MKKLIQKVVVSVVAVMAMAVAADEILFMQIDQDESQENLIAFSFAKLHAQESSGGQMVDRGYVPFAANNAAVTELAANPTLSGGLGYDAGPVNAYFGTMTGENYTYLVELYNAASAIVGYSSSYYTYDYLKNYMYRPLETGSASMMSFSSFSSSAVPEPTSGLMFLVGGVLLALKRRRVVALA